MPYNIACRTSTFTLYDSGPVYPIDSSMSLPESSQKSYINAEPNQFSNTGSLYHQPGPISRRLHPLRVIIRLQAVCPNTTAKISSNSTMQWNTTTLGVLLKPLTCLTHVNCGEYPARTGGISPLCLKSHLPLLIYFRRSLIAYYRSSPHRSGFRIHHHLLYFTFCSTTCF